MSRPSRFLLAAAAMMSLCLSTAATAQRSYDPPGRVARISDMRGEISYSPAGDGEWYSAQRNRPLVRGDALWSDRGSRAEVQVGSSWIRMDGETSLEFLELTDRMLQIEVAEGTLNVRIRRLYPGQRIEVDTPNLALVLDRPGNFRIDVDREGDNTTIEAREGSAMVYGVGGRFPVRRGDVVVFYAEDVRDYEMYAFPAPDSFDRYTRMRDQRVDRSLALRYLGDDLVGFADLDDYGRWSRYPAYGAVWFPSDVYAGWAPYQDGQWIWQDPWGWTWVDDEPWGFAPSHYGRWAWIEGRWGWVPGPRSYRPVYAPALVAFLEDAAGSIGWFPLGPGDIYYPTYSVSSNYFTQVNTSNSTLVSANVGRAYSSFGRANSVPLAQGTYRNRTAPAAITTVPRDVFTSSRPVRQAALRGGQRDPRAAASGELRRNLAVRPGAASMRGAATAARVRPPRAVEDQQVFVRTAPPAQVASPSATSTPAPAPAVRERPRRVRMITEQAASTDARASGPRTESPATASAAPSTTAAAPGGRLQQLDREALPRTRGGRRFQERQQQREQAVPQPAAPAVTPPAATPATPATPAAQAATEEAKQAEEARAAAQKAREEQRQAMEAERKSQQEQRQATQAESDAQLQRAQAQAESDAQQQREASAAEAKALQEREQARAAEREAQRQQREAERAQRQAEQQQKEATQAAQTADAAQAATPASAATSSESDASGPAGQRRECVPAERIEAMRKRGVSEERIAELKVCPPAEAVKQ